MSDDRLFVSNNAIGRKWYYLNILILFVLAAATHFVFNRFIIPNVLSDFYHLVSQAVLYFAYFIYFIAFLSLVDRRLYDICASREAKVYKSISSLIWITIILQLFSFYCQAKNPVLPVSIDLIQTAAIFLDFVFVCIVFFIGTVKGKISEPSAKKPRKK